MYGKLFNHRYQEITEHEQLELWSEIIGRSVGINEKIANPCRVDHNPRCFLRQWNGLILLTDFAYPKYNGYTAFHAYRDIHNLSSLNQAASCMLSNFSAKRAIDKPITKKRRNKSSIYFEPYLYNNSPTFLQRDKEYWSKRGITREQLERHNIYSVYRYHINNYTFYPKGLCYAYVLNSGNIKIYQPYSKDYKWTSNTEVNDIWTSTYFPSSNICILTKSLKDLMVIENLYPDIDVISFQNEGVVPNLDIFSMYDYIYILYDNDKPGVEQSKKVKKELNKVANCETIYIPLTYQAKDVDELYINYGKDTCKMTLNKLLNLEEEPKLITQL